MFSGQKFFDDLNFPRGFGRSGFFTIKEAELMENSGRTMKGLFEGILVAQNEDQKKFIDEVNGRLELESKYALCWVKYLQKINNKDVLYNLCSTFRNGAAEDYTETETVYTRRL